MRVVFMSGSAELGGAERSLLDMLASVRAARPNWHLELVAPADGPLLAEAIAVHVSASVVSYGDLLARVGEPPIVRSVSSLTRLRGLASAVPPLADYLRRLRMALHRIAPDVVHTHGMKAHLLAAWTAPRTSRVIWHLHDYLGRRPRSASALRHSLRRCAAVLTNSVSVAEDARRALEGRVPVVPVLNAVDLERFRPDGSPHGLLENGSPTSRSPLRVGLVATFGRWKGHPTFIDALARLSPALRVQGVIVGGPVYRTEDSQFSPDELRQYARQRGVADRLTFTGFQRDVETVLRSLDVVVHASTEPEPFGLVIAEAMACGRPVVVADAGGARELVTPGVDAALHRPGDAASLASCIEELATDADLRQRLGAEARRTAVRRFDRARLAAEIIPVYERVVPWRRCA